MELYKLLDISLDEKELICIVGAGGKTTTSFFLAKELKELGKKVLVANSTAIFYPDKENYDHIIVTSKRKISFPSVEKGSITVIGRQVTDEGKLLGLDKEIIDDIFDSEKFDFIIVEADGAKKKPIKAPANHEPVIPNKVTKTIGVIGLDSIGKEIDERFVHRPEIFCNVTGKDISQKIDEEAIAKLVISKDGLFKSVPLKVKKYLILNKAEGRMRKESAFLISKLVKNYLARIITSSFQNKEILTCNN